MNAIQGLLSWNTATVLLVWLGVGILFSTFVNNNTLENKRRNSIKWFGTLLAIETVQYSLSATIKQPLPMEVYAVPLVVVALLVISDWIGFFIYKVNTHNSYKFWTGVYKVTGKTKTVLLVGVNQICRSQINLYELEQTRKEIRNRYG